MEKLMMSLAVAVIFASVRMMANPAPPNSVEHRTGSAMASANMAAQQAENGTAVPDTVQHPADAIGPVQDAVERRADRTATALSAMAPLPLGDHGTLTGAKAEGRTIELDIRLAQDLPPSIPEDAFDRGLTAVACKEKNVVDLLAQGGAIRYAIATADGRTLNPVTVANCPAGG